MMQHLTVMIRRQMMRRMMQVLILRMLMMLCMRMMCSLMNFFRLRFNLAIDVLQCIADQH